MPSWSSQELIEYELRKRSIAKRKTDARAAGLSTLHTEPAKGKSLDRQVSREATGRHRVKIRFAFFATRPVDWDGYSVKELQDLLVVAGILDSDQWDFVQGEVVSEKVCTKEEERTEITIEPMINPDAPTIPISL